MLSYGFCPSEEVGFLEMHYLPLYGAGHHLRGVSLPSGYEGYEVFLKYEARLTMIDYTSPDCTGIARRCMRPEPRTFI